MTNVRYYGNAPYQVAVVHGGPGAPGSVAAIARELSKKMSVLEPIQTKTNLEGQIIELRDIIEKFEDVPITLMGHSWGAWLVVFVAARFPQLVKKLILVSSGPFEEKYVQKLGENRLKRLSPDERKEFNVLLGRLQATEGNNKNRDLERLGELSSKTDSFHPIKIVTEQADMLQVEGETFQSVWNEAALLRKSGELMNMVRSLQCPVIAIHGDTDPHPAEGVKEPLEKALEDFQFYLLNKCGHDPWKEHFARDLFYQILNDVI